MKSYSQECMQDIFASFVNNNINNGFVVDIGCKTPGNGNNSTIFLEKGWSGVGADITNYSEMWSSYEKFKFYNMDVTIKENIDLLFSTCPVLINFLSLDVDEHSYNTLKNIDFNKFKFKCICIEHDYYRFGELLRVPQREFLKNYSRVIQTQAEDWYVDYSLLNKDIIKVLKNIPEHKELNGNEMNIILEWIK